MHVHHRSLSILFRMVLASALLLTMLGTGVMIANSAEIIPAVGLTRPVDGEEGGGTRVPLPPRARGGAPAAGARSQPGASAPEPTLATAS